MIDIRLIRTNPELVKENIKKKFQDEKLVLVDEVIELDSCARRQPKRIRCAISAMCPASRLAR